MQTRKRSIDQIIEEQVQRWEFLRREAKPTHVKRWVVTVSREPGSGGHIIAEELARQLGFDFFHQNMIHEMAHSAHVSSQLVQSLDEKGLNVLENWISSVVDRKHLWPDDYLKHLMKILGTICSHGKAVIVGRGANFLLPSEEIFRVRVIAPREFRAQKVAETFQISMKEAKRRILKTESDRKAFMWKNFHGDVADPANYDLVINTGTVTINEAVACVVKILKLRES